MIPKVQELKLRAWVVAVLRVGNISSPTFPISNVRDTLKPFYMGGCGVGVCGGVPSGVPHALSFRSGAGQVYRAP